MKSKFLVLGVCLAALSTSHANAQNTKIAQCRLKNAISKGDVSVPFLKASAKNIFPLRGDSSFYNAIPFMPSKDSNTDSRKMFLEVTLESGSYQINFAGSFETMQSNGSTVSLAVRVGDSILDESINNIEVSYDASQKLTLTQIVTVNEKTKVSIVAKNMTEGKQVLVSDRFLSITKLS